MKTLALVVVVMLVSACTTTSSYNPPVYESSPMGGQAPVMEAPAAPMSNLPAVVETEEVVSSSTTVDRLYGQAQQLMAQADYSQASTELERAIRIAPRDARLYLALAQVRAKQGKTDQAQQLCKRAVSLSTANTSIKEQCQMLFSSPA